MVRFFRALSLRIVVSSVGCSDGGSGPKQCPYLGGSAVYSGGDVATLVSPADGATNVPTTVGTTQFQTKLRVFFNNPVSITVFPVPISKNGQPRLTQTESVKYRAFSVALSVALPTLAPQTTAAVVGCHHGPHPAVRSIRFRRVSRDADRSAAGAGANFAPETHTEASEEASSASRRSPADGS
jgi:hypothetical protein